MGKFGTLYIVATPIGNLSDISYRAVEVLKSVDIIAAEDTRNTLKLLNHYDIKRPLLSYHEHNKNTRGPKIIDQLLEGKNLALVSDAGMPAVSDPGEDLVALCHERGITVNVIPGASALICAVAASGMGSGRFCFEGFLSTAKKSRSDHLNSLKNERRAMVFYEAPHKLVATLEDFEKTFSASRKMLIARELTKKYEEIFKTTVGEALQKYKDLKPLGEFVLVVEGIEEESPNQEDNEQKATELIESLKSDGLSNKEILTKVCADLNLKRNQVYKLINQLNK